MLDVADNLERAAGAVPEAAMGDGWEVDAAEVQKQLRTLLEGVKMTQQVLNQVTLVPHMQLAWRVRRLLREVANITDSCLLLQAFRLNGVEPFRPEGEKFDPNQHEALFQLPDPSKEPGTVGVVTKVRRFTGRLVALMLHDVGEPSRA